MAQQPGHPLSWATVLAIVLGYLAFVVLLLTVL